MEADRLVSMPVEVCPTKHGWRPMGSGLWKLPDGKLYQFAPGQKEVLVEPRFGVALLPCPFCGSEGVQSTHPEVFDMVIVGCIDPDCAGHQVAYDFVDLGAAANHWNRRPALSPPAEGEVSEWRFCPGANGKTALERVRTPTPAPADHIGDATEKVDWQRVGPKLVEALEIIAAAKRQGVKTPMTYAGGFDAGCDWASGVAERALAAAQPQSNGE